MRAFGVGLREARASALPKRTKRNCSFWFGGTRRTSSGARIRILDVQPHGLFRGHFLIEYIGRITNVSRT